VTADYRLEVTKRACTFVLYFQWDFFPFQVVYPVRIVKMLAQLTSEDFTYTYVAKKRFSVKPHIFSFHGDARVLANASLSDAIIVSHIEIQ